MRLESGLLLKWLRMLALLFVIATAMSEVRAADDSDDCYKNKTVAFAVAAPPGGSYDTRQRALPPRVVIAIHGGRWKGGSAAPYASWGAFLAVRGIAMFAIEYRLMTGTNNLYPGSERDVRAAAQLVRANAIRLQLDPDRIGLVGIRQRYICGRSSG